LVGRCLETDHNKEEVMFKPSASAVVQDWITPPHVEVISVATQAGQFERIMQRAKELREQMGPRYLCHQQNRVSRRDGRVFNPLEAANNNVRRIQRKQAA
jgi:hypothetical protein